MVQCLLQRGRPTQRCLQICQTQGGKDCFGQAEQKDTMLRREGSNGRQRICGKQAVYAVLNQQKVTFLCRFRNHPAAGKRHNVVGGVLVIRHNIKPLYTVIFAGGKQGASAHFAVFLPDGHKMDTEQLCSALYAWIYQRVNAKFIPGMEQPCEYGGCGVLPAVCK